MAYAVHTRSCTYLLDDDGICRWTLAPTGIPVPGADRYLGAQFVACLDVREAGGLVGELRIGAAALFARSEGGRLVLLRTPLIEFVEHRPDDADASTAAEPSPPPPARESLPSYTPHVGPPPAYAPRPSAPEPSAPGYPAPPCAEPAYAAPAHVAPAHVAPTYVATAPLPRPVAPPRMFPAPRAPQAPIYAPAPELDLDEEVDVEELVTFSEVTLTIPLYRPETQTAAPLPRHRVIRPGRRLR